MSKYHYHKIIEGSCRIWAKKLWLWKKVGAIVKNNSKWLQRILKEGI